MTTAARTSVRLLALALLAAPCFAAGGPVDDHLPPPARQAERRSVGAGDPYRRAYYDGRGAATAALPRGQAPASRTRHGHRHDRSSQPATLRMA